MAEIIANGVRLHVQRLVPRDRPCRSGRPAIFIHGLGIDNLSSFYYTLANPVARAGTEAIMYDLRGHGVSERPPNGYRVADFVADLEALLDALDLAGPVHLVGNSFGGAVALGFAVANPDRVASMVLIEGHFAVAGWAEQMESTLRSIGSDLAAGNTQLWQKTYGRKLGRMAELADALINGTTFLTDLHKVDTIDPRALQELTCPVRAVYGEHSDVIGYAHQLRQFLPSLTMTVLPGLGHFVLTDATATLREIVVNWFTTQDSLIDR
ncbi:MAG: alpha/beta hydrolase [Pseudonocardiales bacterium]|nr:alpha/beta hydrolase [Pseudonocardiales bacterium]